MTGGSWWLASYPKSGNTWLRAVIATLISERPVDINAMTFIGGSASARSAFDDALGIDSADLSPEQVMNLRPRAFEVWSAEAKRQLYCKVHDAYQLTPAGEPLFARAATRGAVYVVRDPRAVAVSLAHHFVQPIDAAITRMENPDAAVADSPQRLSDHLPQRLLRWCDHVESWLAAPVPLHLIRYEDMQRDPHSTFAAVAEFLGLGHDRQAIAAAVETTTFSRLQAQERVAGFVEKPREAADFFREGKVDGWRLALTPNQAARIVATHGTVMRRLGYDLTVAPLAAERGAA